MVWTPEQAGEFLDYAETHDIDLYPMFLLILHRGLRRGEGCGLRDLDVDLDERIISVVKQITAVGYEPVFRDVKSDAGSADLPHRPEDRNRAARVPDPPRRLAEDVRRRLARQRVLLRAPRRPPLAPARPSATGSSTSSPRAACHRSACTTCVTAPRPTCAPAAPTSKRSRNSSATPASAPPRDIYTSVLLEFQRATPTPPPTSSPASHPPQHETTADSDALAGGPPPGRKGPVVVKLA